MIKFVCTCCRAESDGQGPVHRYSEVGDHLPVSWVMVCDPEGCSTVCPDCQGAGHTAQAHV